MRRTATLKPQDSTSLNPFNVLLFGLDQHVHRVLNLSPVSSLENHLWTIESGETWPQLAILCHIPACYDGVTHPPHASHASNARLFLEERLKLQELQPLSLPVAVPQEGQHLQHAEGLLELGRPVHSHHGVEARAGGLQRQLVDFLAPEILACRALCKRFLK